LDGDYAPSGVTVKVESACVEIACGIGCQAGLTPISRPSSSTDILSEVRKWLLQRAETEMVQDTADRDQLGEQRRFLSCSS
jgi:hypothetical protein